MPIFLTGNKLIIDKGPKHVRPLSNNPINIDNNNMVVTCRLIIIVNLTCLGHHYRRRQQQPGVHQQVSGSS